MIEQTLQFIQAQLSADATLGLDSDMIIADNLHTLQVNTSKEGLFYSLINIEEEGTMKNRKQYVRVNDQLKRMEPPVVLNLYVLFAFRLTNYNTSLIKLSQLISFFQTNRWFVFDGVSDIQAFDPPIDRIVFELYNTSFEQLNHIWSILGGNHYPSVLYKVRVVKVQRNIQFDSTEIKEISVDADVMH